MELDARRGAALYRQLALLQRGAHGAAALAAQTGLSEMQCDALRWVAWLPTAQDACLRLGFADGCALPIRLQSKRGAVTIRAQRAAPMLLHGDVLVENHASANGVGTLTTIVKQRGSGAWYGLGAGHVLGGSAHASIGDRIVLQCGVQGKSINGKLERWTPSFHAGSPDSMIDAGIARLEPHLLGDLLDQGMQLPTGIDDVEVGETAYLRTRGQSIACELLGYVTARMGRGQQGSDSAYQLVDGLAYQASVAPVPGDSGAPLWDNGDRLAAMHVGAGAGGVLGNGIAVPIRRVLDFFDCTIAERGMSLTQAGAPAPLVPLAAGPAPSAASDKVTLARTLWGEARGEGAVGMQAVASVILNRVKRQTYWGRTIDEVCCKPYQFSCWNKNDRNREQLLLVTQSDRDYVTALAIAADAIAHQLSDDTHGATHYHASNMSILPRWAQGHAPCARIGRHQFYNDIN